MVAPALIAAGGSILGALLGRQKPIKAGDNAYSHVKGITRAAEDFGFNPLTLLGSVGPVGGTQGQNHMGSAIADAALMLADGYARNANTKVEAERNMLDMKNRRLESQLAQQTLRPKVGGIYGGNVLTPSLAAALGRVSPGASTAAAAAGAWQPSVGAALPAYPPPGAVEQQNDVLMPDPMLNRGPGFFAFGNYVPSASNTSPAEVMENNYGEIAGEITGLPNLVIDTTMNAINVTLREINNSLLKAGKRTPHMWAADRGYVTLGSNDWRNTPRTVAGMIRDAYRWSKTIETPKYHPKSWPWFGLGSPLG